MKPPNLMSPEVISEVGSQVVRPPLKRLFEYGIDTDVAKSFWSDTDAYRRNTVLVAEAAGKALLVALELSESASKPFSDGSVSAPLAAWEARFVVGLPPGISHEKVDSLGTIACDGLKGGLTSVSYDKSSCTATYAYWQLLENRHQPLDPDTLAKAVWQLGGFGRDNSEPNFWLAAEPQFNVTAADLAYAVAPSGFHDASRELRQPPFIQHLAHLTTGS